MRPKLVTRLKEEWNNLDPVDPLRGLIADAIDALAEQPAQQQEPVALEQYDAGLLNDFGGGNVEWWWDYIRAELGRAYEHYQAQIPPSQPARQEPVAWLHPANATCVTTDPTAYARGIPLYISPPASKPWVGLTDEDILRTKSQFKGTLDVQFDKFARAIEAKLREKNA